MAMDESEFDQRVDDILVKVEDAVDDADAEIDYDTIGGVLTLEFENGSKVIINRQAALQQIWVATKMGGFHFEFDDASDTWQKDDDKTELFVALSNYCSEQSADEIKLSE